MKRIKETKEMTYEFNVIPPLYIPFYNKWSQNVYWQYKAFDLDPFTLRAESTSGSPVILVGNKFFGFLNTKGGRFVYDGAGSLSITVPKGQELLYDECCDPYKAWEEYSKVIASKQPSAKFYEFWNQIEYCTWVEQKKQAKLSCGAVRDMINEDFVRDYINRIHKLGLPKGKFTIDDGWAINKDSQGKTLLGDWEVDPEKFPNMPGLVKDLKKDGYTPGIWLAPTLLTTNSKVAMEHPDWVGDDFNSAAENKDMAVLKFLLPKDGVREYYYQITKPLIDMGFKKLKIDMTYGNKAHMISLLRMFYEEVKKQSDQVEVEIHIPDIFACCYADSIRINDVLFDKDQEWRGVTYEHYKVCKYSAPHKLINVDHIGTNTDLPSAKDFLDHWDILKTFEGYKVISLLPDYFAPHICSRIVDEMKMHFG